MHKKSLLLIFTALAGSALSAQEINAPYSTYGAGDLDFRYYDKSMGMGHASIALLSTPFGLLNKNPASLAGIERSHVMVNASFVGKTVKYSGTPINSDNQNSRDVAIKNFSLAIRLNKFWASGISVQPFSYVNYAYRSNINIEGSSQKYDALYEGDGGIYNVSWNNAFAVSKHFSMGIRSSFLFGSINQTEILESALLANPVETKKTDYYHHFRFEYGALYRHKLSKKLEIGVGGKFSTKTKLNAEQSMQITEGSTIIRKEDLLKRGTFILPMTYDVGLSLISNGRTTYAVDYTFENWDGVRQKGYTWSMINSHRLMAGVQISNQVEKYDMKFEKSYWQLGMFGNRSYLRVNNVPIDEIGITGGYGGYMSGRLNYGISLEVGRRGTIDKGLIRENYVQATLRLSYREMLYSKGRKYD